MSKHTWQQWSALGAFIVYVLCLLGMLTFYSNNLVFYILVAIQATSVIWIGILHKKWPDGGQS